MRARPVVRTKEEGGKLRPGVERMAGDSASSRPAGAKAHSLFVASAARLEVVPCYKALANPGSDKFPRNLNS